MIDFDWNFDEQMTNSLLFVLNTLLFVLNKSSMYFNHTKSYMKTKLFTAKGIQNY